MIDESAAFVPIWMVFSAAFGFMIGVAYGDQARHRKCLEQANDDLRDQLQNTEPCTPTLKCELKQQRHVINDIHKRLIAVTKSLETRAS